MRVEPTHKIIGARGVGLVEVTYEPFNARTQRWFASIDRLIRSANHIDQIIVSINRFDFCRRSYGRFEDAAGDKKLVVQAADLPPDFDAANDDVDAAEIFVRLKSILSIISSIYRPNQSIDQINHSYQALITSIDQINE